jgi:cyclohexadienyl dehydratase
MFFWLNHWEKSKNRGGNMDNQRIWRENRLLFVISPLLAMAFLLFLIADFSAFAEESKLKQIIQAKEIRIGTSGDYQPFSYLHPKTNQYEGMDIELAHKLGQVLQAKVTFVRFKWPELTPDLLAGKFDIAMGGIGRNVERGKIFAYTNSYMTFGTCPLVRKADEDKFPDFGSINRPGVKVILNQGGLNDRHFTPLLTQATILRHNKNEEIAEKVKDGTADVWITDNVEALFWAKQIPGLVAVNPSKTFTVGTKGFMIRQGDQIFLNWLNLWLEQMFLQGEVQRLEQQWLGTVMK